MINGLWTNEIMNTTSVFVLLFFPVVGMFFAGGSILVRALPPVRKFTKIQGKLRDAELDLTRVANIDMSSFCKREFQDFYANDKYRIAGVNFKHHPMGDAVDIVHYRGHSLKKTIKELRAYCFVALILGGIGFLKYGYDNEFKISFTKFFLWLNNHPLELVALAELVMITFLIVRLINEILTISDLVKE